MLPLIKLFRLHQWTKNALVFAALIFSRNILNTPLIVKSLLGFAVFCAVSSCVYIINDLVDCEKDRLHPKKRHRPIASGTVNVLTAAITLGILLGTAIVGAFMLNFTFGLTVILYLGMNVTYSFWLKHIPILDMLCIAIGFVLRAISGSFIIGVKISPWMLMCVFLLAIFLVLHKRYNELTTNGVQSRKILESYSAEMLREMLSAVNGAILVAYSLYCFFATGTVLMLLTIPFVVYGMFRYILVVHSFQDLAETPELVIIKDKPFLINITIWGILCAVIMFVWGGDPQ